MEVLDYMRDDFSWNVLFNETQLKFDNQKIVHFGLKDNSWYTFDGEYFRIMLKLMIQFAKIFDTSEHFFINFRSVESIQKTINLHLS